MSSLTRGRKIHILTQFLWPDGCPTGIYVEQLAQHFLTTGSDVLLVGGSGRYRHSSRPDPQVPTVRLQHRCGSRGNLISVASEYLAVLFAFKKYISENVQRGDVVIATTAPPSSVLLASDIRKKGALSIYWIQDYYPELIRALWDYPSDLRKFINSRWDHKISEWDQVVKTAGNLGYDGRNVSVIRNWPTLDLGKEVPFIPKTALYSGNFGYIHHVPTFLDECAKLIGAGYEVTVRGDGPGLQKMPSWIKRGLPLNTEDLRRSYWEAEVHLIAAHPKIERAVFPSKIYNSLATGRKLVCTGFEGLMKKELEAVRNLDWKASSLSSWSTLLKNCQAQI
jgi:hypothetical protein